MSVIEFIDAEIIRLQHARALLVETPVKRGPGRPKGFIKLEVASRVEGKRVMSAEGRARIADAQKKRWAAKRKTAKKGAAVVQSGR